MTYVRTGEGFVTNTDATVARDENGGYRVGFMNPGSNQGGRSVLRVINANETDAEVVVSAIDDDGMSPGEPVELTVPAGETCMVTSGTARIRD